MEARDHSPDAGRACPTNLLSDEPADADFFSTSESAGSHSRLAQAISNVVETESGGKLISLEGAWGSGKSTVISLVEKNLQTSSRTLAFRFDAWSHSGDPLKLVLLQGLANALNSKSWLKNWGGENGWEERLSFLAKRKRVTTTKAIPKATFFGAVFAGLLLLVPVGIAVLESALDDPVTFKIGADPYWKFIVAAGLAAGPLLWSILTVVTSTLRGRKVDLALLTGTREVESVVHESLTPDPTSIEFESTFQGLIADALEDSDRRLVLTIDNLDRVGGSELASVWGSLQSFMNLRPSIDKPWMERFWVLVPFDPGEVVRLWPGAVSSPASIESSSLLDKSFHARFELPLPIASDWRQLLRKLLGDALPRHEKDAELVTHVFAIANQGREPSPREIKSAINQIGSIHRQWPCGEFPIPHIAYFVLLRRSNKNVASALLEPNGIEPRIETILGEGLRKSLAGLAFNVGRERGIEILLKEPIESALTSGDSEALESLALSNPIGFWAVMPQIYSTIERADSYLLSKIVLAVMRSKVPRDSGELSGLLLRVIASRAEGIESWLNIPGEVGTALAALATESKFPSLERRLESSIRKTLLEASKTTRENEDRSEELKAIELASSFGDELLAHGIEITRPFQHGKTAGNWIANLEPIDKEEASPTATRMEPYLSASDLVQHLASRASAGHFDGILRAIRKLKSLDATNWAYLDETLWGRLRPEVDFLELVILLNSLAKLIPLITDEPTDDLQALRKRGIVRIWESVRPDNSIQLSINAFLLMLKHYPDLPNGHATEAGATEATENALKFLDQSSPELIRQVFDELKHSGLVDEYLHYELGRKAWDKSAEALIPTIFASPDHFSDQMLEYLFGSWSSTVKRLLVRDGVDLLQLYLQSQSKESVVEAALSQEFEADLIDLYARMRDYAQSTELDNWCKAGLSRLSATEIEKILSDEELLDRLSFYVDTSRKNGASSGALPMGFLDYSLDRLTKVGDKPDPLLGRTYRLMDDKQREEFDSAAAVALLRRIDLPWGVMQSLAITPALANHLLLNPDSGEFLRRSLEFGDVRILDWLGVLLDSASASTVRKLKKGVLPQRIKDLIQDQSTSEEFRGSAIRLGQRVGIREQ